jgi:uncharacterized FAD-dependent dehydrogenase
VAIQVSNLILNLDDDISELEIRTAENLGISKSDITDFQIIRKSVDARKKNNIKLNYTVQFKCESENFLVKNFSDIAYSVPEYQTPKSDKISDLKKKIVIIGSGPSGLFAALVLSENGYSPVIIERGCDVDTREIKIRNFWENGILDINSNVQFGEGGAGTFSDGKLVSRIRDPRCSYVIRKFIEFGAPQEIRYSAKPHIGSDYLKKVIKNMRNHIIDKGGKFYFETVFEKFIIRNNKIIGIETDKGNFESDSVLLAAGHSCREVFRNLDYQKILISQKPFAVGFRIEHLRKMIDKNQYGKFAGHPQLGAADYKLTYNCQKTGRGVYSFCMCPGGIVTASSSSPQTVVTNGMSYYKRDLINSNSAIVTTVRTEDLNSDSPLAGIEFQYINEHNAYVSAGNNYYAPVQLCSDFMNGAVSKKFLNVKPTYKPGTHFVNLEKFYNKKIINAIKSGLKNFEKKIKNFSSDGALLTGLETRTSSPVRIDRNPETRESLSHKGLFPIGEGSGYAGGIMSAAVDGIKTAETLISTIL